MPKLSDLMARSKAAKGSQKEMPPEAEEEMPIEEPIPAEMPPEEALAAGAGEEMPPELPGGEAPMPEEGGPPDIDMALANVEAALADLSPEVQEEVRTHLNAIRDLVGGGMAPEGEGAPPTQEDPMAPQMVPPTAKTNEAQL